jgi:hypothetical protein
MLESREGVRLLERFGTELGPRIKWESAADAADSYLEAHDSGAAVCRDPLHHFENSEVYVFIHVPNAVDDPVLVVDKSDLTVRMTSASPWRAMPSTDTQPLGGYTG